MNRAERPEEQLAVGFERSMVSVKREGVVDGAIIATVSL